MPSLPHYFLGLVMLKEATLALATLYAICLPLTPLGEVSDAPPPPR